MKIISKFSDHYDHCIGYDSDNSIVYVREKKEYEGAIPFIFLPSQFLMSPKGESVNRSYSRFISRRNQYLQYNLSSGKIFLAGNSYLYVRVDIFYDTEVETKYFWNFESLKTFIDQCEWNIDPNLSKYSMAGGDPIFNDSPINTYLYDFLVANKIVIAHVCMKGYAPSLTLNPRLADYNFYAVMHPTQVYQEIEMWLGGVLSVNKDGPKTERSESLNLLIHGFDKWSFRKKGKNSK